MDMSIFAKTTRVAGCLALALWPALSCAQGLTCVAETQCRGDAERMCAPSALSIKAERRGAWVDMWIDNQGPYRAEFSRRAQEARLTLPLFEDHEMILEPDGAFLYRGNRGKRYSGRCEGGL